MSWAPQESCCHPGCWFVPWLPAHQGWVPKTQSPSRGRKRPWPEPSEPVRSSDDVNFFTYIKSLIKLRGQDQINSQGGQWKANLGNSCMALLQAVGIEQDDLSPVLGFLRSFSDCRPFQREMNLSGTRASHHVTNILTVPSGASVFMARTNAYKPFP